jgi:beta-glucosidase
VVHYDEGLLVGYRWYDTKKIEPLFPFGFGLSYTTFAYSNLRVTAAGPSAATVECDVTNTGAAPGPRWSSSTCRTAIQVQRPEKELKGFAKVSSRPGETKTVRAWPSTPGRLRTIRRRKHSWVVEAGDFGILVGGSSRDIRQHADYSITAASAAVDMAPGAGTEPDHSKG